MSRLDQTEEIPRRVLTLYYLIDTSGSMYGEKIASLNVAIRETLPMISEISANNSDAKIKVAAMDFATVNQWMHPTPVESEDFQWRDLEADGLTNLGEAYQELNNKLSRRKGFMNGASGSYAPAIILMSDGGPTDDAEHGLEKLKTNPWFKAAIKVAIAIGDDANTEVLAKFTGNSEAVLRVHNIDQLKQIIRLVSVTASRVASKSTSVGSDAPGTKNEETLTAIKNAIEKDPTLGGLDVGDSDTNAGTDDWGAAGW